MYIRQHYSLPLQFANQTKTYSLPTLQIFAGKMVIVHCNMYYKMYAANGSGGAQTSLPRRRCTFTPIGSFFTKGPSSSLDGPPERDFGCVNCASTLISIPLQTFFCLLKALKWGGWFRWAFFGP